MMANGKESVKVIVRCRPMSDKESAAGYSRVVDVSKNQKKIRIKAENDIGEAREFTYDAAYGNESSQSDIYEESVRPLVDAVLQGFNATVFAYGQTGTGKTFTMQGTREQPGIIPRAMEHIFKHIDESHDERFLEELRDLLKKRDPDDKEKKLEIKERSNGEIYIKNLSQFQLKSLHQMEKMMDRGQSNRATGATDMNEYSSRSHAVFTVNVESAQVSMDGKEHVRVGKLNLVDLAGSEKQSKTNSTGDRFKEATQINLSLTTLGMVITNLVEKNGHVPYRDSKLTRLLQDSLGGNSKTIMVANIGPAAYNIEETLSTLRYAHRAKSIKNSPHVNEDPKDAKMREYLDELNRLRALLASKANNQRVPGDAPNDDEDAASDTSDQFVQEHAQIEEEKKKIMENTNLNNAAKNRLLADYLVKEDDLRKREAERKELKTKLEEIEQRLLRGHSYAQDVKERVAAQQQTIQKHKADIEKQEKREKRILAALEQEQRNAEDVKGTVSSVQAEIDKMNLRIERLRAEFGKLEREKQAEEAVSRGLNEDASSQVELSRQREALLWLMVTHFVSPSLWEPLIQNASYDEETNEWELPSESMEVSRPPLFLGTHLNGESRLQYQPLLMEDVIDIEIDLSGTEGLRKENVNYSNILSEEDLRSAVLKQALDKACSEEDLVIDADVFTIDRSPLSTASTRRPESSAVPRRINRN